MAEEQTINIDGRERRYLLSRPDGDDPAPLVLALHGGGGNAQRFADTTNDLAGQGVARGYLVAFADGTGPSWPNGGGVAGLWNSGPHCHPQGEIDDVAFLVALIEHVDALHPVDRSRVYACGHSNGLMMSYRLACERSDVFAAIAGTGGSLDVDGPVPSHGVSVLHVHGTHDQLHPFEGGPGIVPNFPGPFLGPVRATQQFVEWNSCEPEGEVVDKTGCVTFTRWGGGRDGAEVVLGRMEGVGHQWPPWFREMTVEQARAVNFEVLARQGPYTTDIDMSALALDFFDRHAR